MANGTFATAINCIDGRTQHAVSDWMKINFHVDYVDMITEAGPDKVLTQGTPVQLAAIKQKVLVSVNAHHSRVIAIAAHYDCAGNPVTDEEHKEHIKQSVAVIQGWELPVRVVGIWINSWWQAELVYNPGA